MTNDMFGYRDARGYYFYYLTYPKFHNQNNDLAWKKYFDVEDSLMNFCEERRISIFLRRAKNIFVV